jgi:hypothetical protein
MYWHWLQLLLYSNSSYKRWKKKIHQKSAKFLARTGTVVVSRYHVETTPVSPGVLASTHNGAMIFYIQRINVCIYVLRLQCYTAQQSTGHAVRLSWRRLPQASSHSLHIISVVYIHSKLVPVMTSESVGSIFSRTSSRTLAEA